MAYWRGLGRSSCARYGRPDRQDAPTTLHLTRKSTCLYGRKIRYRGKSIRGWRCPATTEPRSSRTAATPIEALAAVLRQGRQPAAFQRVPSFPRTSLIRHSLKGAVREATAYYTDVERNPLCGRPHKSLLGQ